MTGALWSLESRQFLSMEEVDWTHSDRTIRHLVCLHLHRPVSGAESRDESSPFNTVFLSYGGNLLLGFVSGRKATDVKVLALNTDEASLLIVY